MKTLVCLLLFSLVTGCSSYEPYVVSTSQIGTVASSTGFPTVIRNARPYILAEQSAVYTGDIITTDEQSLLHLRLDSGTTLKLGTRSHLLVRQVSPEGSGYRHRFTLSRGSLEVVSPGPGNHQHRNEYEIATTIAQVRAEQARFWLGYIPQTKGIDVVSLSTGELTISNQSGEVTLEAPYQVARVTPGAAPTGALTWSEQRFTSNLKRYTRTSR